MNPARPRRSALYLPASNARAIDKARTLACDVVILDLEDAVAPEAKAVARDQAVAALRDGGFGHRELVVRVNALSTPWGEADLAAFADASSVAVLAPKIAAAADVGAYAERLPAGAPLWLMIETARSVLRLEEIAAAPGVAALVIGTNDLAKAMGAQLDGERAPFVGLLALAVAAARAASVAVLDGVYNDLDDVAGFARQCDQGAAFGFDGKTLIHPGQIAACNAAFSPTPEEIAWAGKVERAFAAPEAAGQGVLRVEGRMVERLHLDQALDLLAKARAVAARD